MEQRLGGFRNDTRKSTISTRVTLENTTAAHVSKLQNADIALVTLRESFILYK
jgi:hypothetical protein